MNDSVGETTIHHVDDEPELVNWIVDSFFNYCRSEFPQMSEADYRSLETDNELGEELAVTIKLKPGVGYGQVTYRSYNLNGFSLDRLDLKANDVAILDIMAVEGNQVSAVGLGLLRKVVQRHERERTLVLTGFQRALPAEVRELIPEKNLFFKPSDVTEFIATIARLVGLPG